MDRRCTTFENGISESFNRAILGPTSKPIITMLEEIRLYIMQRLYPMNKIAFNLEDTITPSIRKRLEVLKEKQRHWIVFPSGFQELEELSGVPCVHVVAGYMHLNHDLDTGEDARPKPGIKKPPGRKRQPVTGETTSRGRLCSRGGGRGSRGSGKGGGNNGRGGGNTSRGGGNNGRGCGNSSRGSGNNGRWGSSSRLGITDLGNLWSAGYLIAEQEYQLNLDEEAFRETMEEQDRLEEDYLNMHRQEEEWEARNDYLNPMHWMEEDNEETGDEQQVVIQDNHSQATVDKGKVVEAVIEETHEAVHDTTEQAKVNNGKAVDDTTKQGKSGSNKRNRQKWQQEAYVDGVRIYVKNRGRSKRIANQKQNKPFKFDKMGIGSTSEKAFAISEFD
ncbi:hypothetical protein Tco_1025606 [Tanacetum coccineum]